MNQMRYDLHIHSEFSDGRGTVREIAMKALEVGLDTIGICDHFWPCHGSRRAGAKLIETRREQIWNLEKVFKQPRILDGAEVDIASNGTPADIAVPLDSFDIIIGSVHFTTTSTQWRAIIQRAIEKNWEFDILGHWDGYMSSYREEDGVEVAKMLADCGIAVEISTYYRSQFPDFFILARDAGCEFTLGSDAHSLFDVGNTEESRSLVKGLDLPLKRID